MPTRMAVLRDEDVAYILLHHLGSNLGDRGRTGKSSPDLLDCCAVRVSPSTGGEDGAPEVTKK